MDKLNSVENIISKLDSIENNSTKNKKSDKDHKSTSKQTQKKTSKKSSKKVIKTSTQNQSTKLLKKDTPKKNILKKDIALKNISKSYADACNFSLNDYGVYFCSSQNEMYNLIIFSIIKSYSTIVKTPHIVCSSMEQRCIIDILEYYKSQGNITVSYVPANIYGAIVSAEVEKYIKKSTCLVIVSYINYALGTLNNIKLIGETIHKYKVPLFCDCEYILGKQRFNPDANNIDIFTTDLCVNGISLLAVKKTLVDGYKLDAQSIRFQSNAYDFINIDEQQYIRLIAVFNEILSRGLKPSGLSRDHKIAEIKLWLISCIRKYCEKAGNNIYYYDHIVKNNVVPKIGDIVILGYNIEEYEKTIPHVISFIVISKDNNIIEKLKKRGIIIYENDVSSLFYKLGITTKWTKKILTLSLETCTKKDISYFVKSLFQ